MSPAATAIPATQPFDAGRLERVFADCFARRFDTLLLGGASEPVYLPAGTNSGTGRPVPGHRLFYREDFFASALHEVAHWCIAGRERRLQIDFGYWYAPAGRDARVQRRFEAVEAGPQALEWLFSQACGYRFQLSMDNPGNDELAQRAVFARAVHGRARCWQQAGLPGRAGRFYEALGREFGHSRPLDSLALNAEDLV